MRVLLLIIGLILTGLLFYYCCTNQAIAIQQDITQKTAALFAEKNVTDTVSYAVDGRDIQLSGTVVDHDVKNMIAGSVGALSGVRQVDNQIAVVDIQPTIAEAPPLESIPQPDITENDIPFDEPTFDEFFIFEDEESKEEIIAIAETSPVLEQEEIQAEIVQEDRTAEIVDLVPAPVETPVIDPALSSPPPVAEPDVALAPVIETAPEESPAVETEASQIEETVSTPENTNSIITQCQSKIESLVAGEKVNFDSGKSTVKADSLSLLNDIVKQMGDCDDTIALHIHGHTDNQGDKQVNRTLSHNRAKSVGLYLLEKGVTQEVRVFGHGSDQPLAANDSDEGRAQNRRIEFKIAPKKE